ncbi:DUF4468 domain-containing protein [Rhodocytophaga rosea]|uniref:DUF4468 domain-containing protein n=1 Tax=Rhodocytophaga rosea TaxID=2704465 RepID=A0A6C0GFU7_9BACT|nr:DUF4468 domain-containing protein [Rhodocytophaga rosea]QHT66876.1 DUF4468 domain-containing protein [Rhodocytophaga rosea]
MRYVLAILLLFVGLIANSQQILPVDAANKVAFTDVVKAENMKKEILNENINTWLLATQYSLQSVSNDSTTQKLIASSEFPVYARGYVSKKIHGKISYKLTIEVKDNKYRYFFTDFVFSYYKEGRNYTMVPSGKRKPMEDEKAQGWQSLWENHKRTTLSRVQMHINQLVVAATRIPTVQKQVTATEKTRTPAQDW